MSELVTSAVVAFKTLSLVMGGLVTYYAHKAYRRTGARPLGVLALGFAVVTLGALVAGAVDQVLLGHQDYALTVESALTILGFGVILYSLYAE
ncbi:hypothetical protein BRC81_15465 [Halobacteriales archaeon QS_1_68_20]|nr:MAG: hypothetical protein BRC81_15465 [Halobacteriales archaeon QS_1_68_20]